MSTWYIVWNHFNIPNTFFGRSSKTIRNKNIMLKHQSQQRKPIPNHCTKVESVESPLLSMRPAYLSNSWRRPQYIQVFHDCTNGRRVHHQQRYSSGTGDFGVLLQCFCAQTISVPQTRVSTSGWMFAAWKKQGARLRAVMLLNSLFVHVCLLLLWIAWCLSWIWLIDWAKWATVISESRYVHPVASLAIDIQLTLLQN